MIAPAAGAAIGAAAGAFFAAVLLYASVHPSEGYRKAMGYKRWAEYDAAARTRLKRVFVVFILVFTALAAGLGAWVFPKM